MMGPKNLDITLSPDSPPDLAGGILMAADALGFRQDFTFFDREIYDDHVPAPAHRRVPTIDLIDFNYPPGTPPRIRSTSSPRRAFKPSAR